MNGTQFLQIMIVGLDLSSGQISGRLKFSASTREKLIKLKLLGLVNDALSSIGIITTVNDADNTNLKPSLPY